MDAHSTSIVNAKFTFVNVASCSFPQWTNYQQTRSVMLLRILKNSKTNRNKTHAWENKRKQIRTIQFKAKKKDGPWLDQPRKTDDEIKSYKTASWVDKIHPYPHYLSARRATICKCECLQLKTEKSNNNIWPSNGNLLQLFYAHASRRHNTLDRICMESGVAKMHAWRVVSLYIYGKSVIQFQYFTIRSMAVRICTPFCWGCRRQIFSIYVRMYIVTTAGIKAVAYPLHPFLCNSTYGFFPIQFALPLGRRLLLRSAVHWLQAYNIGADTLQFAVTTMAA